MKKSVKNFEELVELVNDSISVCSLDLELEFDIFEFCSGEYKEEGFTIKTFGLTQGEDSVLMINTDEGEPYFVDSEKQATEVIESWLEE